MELSMQEYKAIVESAPNLIWRARLDTLCDYFNKTWLEFTGRTFEQEFGNGWAEGVHPEDLDRCVKTYLDSFKQRKAFEMEYRLRHHSGEWRWINDRGAPYCNEQGEFAGYIGSCVDVTDKVEGQIYKEISRKDYLTGALSRQYLMSQLRRIFDIDRTSANQLVIGMIDIDKFKSINDSYGHSMGDSALKLFASVVRDWIREGDLFGRYGGDEFVVAFRNATVESATDVMNRILEVLRRVALKADQGDILLTFSYGLCSLADQQCVDEMLQAADKAMYEHKVTKAGHTAG